MPMGLAFTGKVVYFSAVFDSDNIPLQYPPFLSVSPI